VNKSLLFVTGGLGAWAASRVLRSQRAISLADRVVVISGGSRGLGLVLARQLAAEGARLALLARTPADLDAALDDLRERTGATALAIPCDVSRREAVDAAIREVVEKLGGVDALVHNAGVIEVGPERHMTEADYREALGVHFWGAYYLTEAVRPHLPRDGSARIAYVSSVGGRVGVPHLAPYAASKHALVGYADALRAELAADGIRVTTVTPGLMRTGSPPNATFKGQHEKEYAWFAISDATPFLSTSAERAAERIVDAFRHGDPALTITLVAKLAAAVDEVMPGLTGTVLKWANRLLPEPTDAAGDRKRTGWESFSDAAPSPLTELSDEATVENNELRGHAPPD
jgi:NAD(P)-dependent dehydrogenase (short-subunit alcohol dehydrogenase family)